MPFRRLKLRPVSEETLALAGLWASLLDFAVFAIALIVWADAWAPPQDLPWKPLSLNAPIGLATGFKFARAAADPALCRKVLKDGGVTFVDAPVRASGFCSTANSVRLEAGALRLSPAGPVITCPLALGYAFWARHVLQPDAQGLLGSRVVEVDHYGSYACRNIDHEAHGAPSQHARANAIDVAGFRLADGRDITVARDFRRTDARGQFLRAVRAGACDWFHGVLSPDYNALHRDHFHLDFGPYRICS